MVKEVTNIIHGHLLITAGKMHTIEANWVASDFHKTTKLTVKRFYKKMSLQPNSFKKKKKPR
jgi:hypothetical protein